jgi:phosphoglycerate dehydrogenase-like enzyme
MPEILTALVTVRYGEAQMARLRKALAPARIVEADRRDDAAIRAALERADVAIVAGDLDRRFLAAPRLAWVQCDHAGIERSALPQALAAGLAISGTAGRSAPALAEHALFFMLALAYDAPALLDAQRARRWGIAGGESRRALHGRTVGIVGMGHTGRALAPLCRALGLRVLAFRRRDAPPPDGVDRVWSADRGETLDPLLGESDIVVLAASLNDRTRGLIGPAALARMRPGAYLVNVARGGLVDEAALVEALASGRLGGAGLDTFAVEPLPPESPLWTAPRLLVTAHQTPPLPDRTERALDIICGNIARWRAGAPLLNRLGPEDAYTPG